MPLILFNGINIVGVLRAGGDTRYAMIVESIAVWLVGVPIAFLSTRFLRLPIYFCVLLVKIEEFSKFYLLFKRFLSKKWVKNVIRNL